MKKTILVTGGAGFIGSYTNKCLHAAGYHTIVLDNLHRGLKSSVVYGKLIIGDISDRNLLNKIFANHHIHAVMHFAANIDVGESVLNPSLYYRNNVLGTLNLLDSMIENGVLKFIFSSTAAVYGNPTESKISESHPQNPINPYGQSKLMVEKWLEDFKRAYNLEYCSLRYFNAAGGDPQREIKHRQLKCHNLIPIILQNIANKKNRVSIFGQDYPTPDGTCIRDYVHIDDLAKAHLLALLQLENGKNSLVYNLGNGNGYSVKEVVNSIEQVLGVKLHREEQGRREGDPPILLADASKAREELNWTPRYSLEEMISHAWENFKK